MFSFKNSTNKKIERKIYEAVKILLSTFRAPLIICTIFGENQIFRVLRQKDEICVS